MARFRHLQRSTGIGFQADRRSAFTHVELIVVITIVCVLSALALPKCNSIYLKGRQIRDLSNTRHIHQALFNYASDHDGCFPAKTVDGLELTNANEAYRNLVPRYMSIERIFYVASSRWCNPNQPDENISPGNCLSAGENNYAYVTGLTTKSDGNFPLVADGFKEGQPGVYTSDEKAKGGLWKGKVAMVIRMDGSAAIEQVCSTDFKVYGLTGLDTGARADIFAPAQGWLEAKNKTLNPTSK